MPRRSDIRSILVIGSGPIVIGQGSEFDYSGTQAAKVLKAEGYRVILVNSNPATIMTDPEFADATYIEPITPEVVAEVIARERPDALLPTLGGQTALNVSVDLARSGVLERHGVEMIGADLEAITTAEHRGKFKEKMEAVGLDVPRAGYARSMADALNIAKEIGYPVMVRPSFILGGSGTGIADTEEQLLDVAREGLTVSPVGEILVEESVLGWKEYELEIMRDGAGNAVIVCGIENFDPMGV
ncbi:MAG: carbamoyl phosphate synthase large subunit, partial [Acidimicrobiia bacterium]